MNVFVEWGTVIALGPKAKFVSEVQNTLEVLLSKILETPGIYVFARRFDKTITPIYVGKALNLKNRIKQQFNNLRLMSAIQDGPSGEIVLLVGQVTPATESKIKRALKIAERTHIEQAMTAGHELLNIQGTRSKHDVVEIKGTKSHTHPFPRTMYRPSSTD
jgi:hypothetical protein